MKKAGYNVLLVDDEIHIVDSLLVSIPWREIGVEQVFSAYSFTQAMEWLDMEAIDIVITDIQMPGKSGLELICEIQKKQKQILFVILSGYSDFHYLKEAIAYQVVDYLLKPVNDQSVVDAVKKCMQKLEVRWGRETDNSKLYQQFYTALPILRENFLQELLSGGEFPKSLFQQKMESYDIKILPEAAVRMLVLHPNRNTSWNPEDHMLRYGIINIAEELIRNEGRSVWSCMDRGGNLLFLAEEPSGSKSENNALMGRIGVNIRHALALHLDIDVSVVVSTPFPLSAELLPVQYEETLKLLRCRLHRDCKIFIDSKEQKIPLHDTGNPLYEYPLLEELLFTAQWEQAKQKVQEIFAWYRGAVEEGCGEIEEAYCSVYSTISAFCYRSGKSDIWAAWKSGKSRGKALENPISDTAELFLEIIRKVQEGEDSERKSTGGYYVELVKKRVLQANLQNVTIQSLADEIGLHPVYLSKLFKEETGMLLSEYLSNIRLQKAEQLLREGNERVHKIALQVGYYSCPYFIKLFKEHYQMTPAEYRIHHS